MKSILRIILLLGLLSISEKIFSQNIQVSIHIQPNLPSYISEWEIDPTLTNIQLFGSLPQPESVVVQVVVSEFSEGQVLTATSVPIQATPGAWQFFINNTEFLDWESLDYAESFEQELGQSGRIPDGDYEICAYVRRFQDPNGPLFGESCMYFTIATQSPPVMLYPVAGNVLIEPVPLFQWSFGGHTAGVNYSLKIVEVLPGQSPEEAVESNIVTLNQPTDQLLFLFDQAQGVLYPCKEYAVWVEVESGPSLGFSSPLLRSEAVPFYWQQSDAPIIMPNSPGISCNGSVGTQSTSTEMNFTFTTSGRFTTFTVVTCHNPCGTYTPGIPTTTSGRPDVPTLSADKGKITHTGPQYPNTPTVVSGGIQPLPSTIADVINGQELGMPYFISNLIYAFEHTMPCENQYYSTTINFQGIIEPGAAFTWYVVGLTTAGTTVTSPSFCYRYAPTTSSGEIPTNVECPITPTCQITLEELVDPKMDGGLTTASKGLTRILRDGFVPLEAEGRDFDQLKIKCTPSNGCEEIGSERRVTLTGRVRYEWEITSEKGEFKKLGCMPEALKKDVGEHVILMPPFIPLPETEDKPNKESIKIILHVIDDNPTQPKDPNIDPEITVEFTRKRSIPDYYEVKITAPAYTLPAIPVTTDKLEQCKPEKPEWDQKADLVPPKIKLPASVGKDNDKMVVGQWIVLEAEDNRDPDILKKLKCLSQACKQTEEKDRIYEDDVEWIWSIVKGKGKIILGDRGRFIIYEAPMQLEEKETKREVILQAKVKNPFAIQIPDAVKTGRITLYIYQAGIKLSHPAANWLPTEDNNVQLTSELVYCTDAKAEGAGANKKIKKTWAPALAHMCRIHFFELDRISREPGLCLNNTPKDKAKTCVDYQWNPEDEHEAYKPDDKLGTKCDSKEHYRSARTQKPVKSYTIKVHANDFGGYTDVSSYANHTHKNNGELKDPRYESVPVTDETAPKHPQGKTKKKTYWDNRVTVPIDIDENYIPDNGWLASVGGGAIPDNVVPVTDADRLPAGDRTNGDGFSVYEEYRGFKIIKAGGGTMHIRLNSNTKDLFVHNPDQFALGAFRTVSALAVHEITEDQYEGNTKRWVNVNHHTAHADDQRGIYLHNIPLALGLLGIAVPIGGSWPAPPNYNKEVDVDKADITRWAIAQGIAAPASINWVVAHELSHACNTYHHGEHPRGGTNFDRVHGLRSGDVACIMRYNNVGTALPAPNNPEAIGTILCPAQAGTGFNAGGNNFRDSDQSNRVNTGVPAWHRGDCLHQLRIKSPLSNKPDFPTRFDP